MGSADHVELLQLMDEIKNMEAATLSGVANASTSEAAVKALLMKWQQLEREMLEHLAEEEADTPEQLRKHCTYAEHDQMVGQILATLGLHGNKIMLPRILSAMQRWGGSEKVAEFKSQIPPPIRLLNHYFWEPAFHQSQQELQSLSLDSPTIAKVPASTGIGSGCVSAF